MSFQSQRLNGEQEMSQVVSPTKFILLYICVVNQGLLDKIYAESGHYNFATNMIEGRQERMFFSFRFGRKNLEILFGKSASLCKVPIHLLHQGARGGRREEIPSHQPDYTQMHEKCNDEE